jgi:hypothetical protein
MCDGSVRSFPPNMNFALFVYICGSNDGIVVDLN